jgi:RecB family exonuclease
VVDAPALVRELTERYLAHDGLSPSAYNEYLESPAAFFAKRVLRLHEPENRAIVVGNAVHAGAAVYLKLKDREVEDRVVAAQAELARSLSRSLLPRGDTFDALTRHARTSLSCALESEVLQRTAVAVEDAFSVKRTVLGKEIILKGKVDAVLQSDTGECIVDFKTSSKIDKKDAEKFQRQLAFYDLLLRENGHQTTSALIVQIGEDEVSEHTVLLNDDTRKELKDTLDRVLEELLTGTWRSGEASEYDDVLALFV